MKKKRFSHFFSKNHFRICAKMLSILILLVSLNSFASSQSVEDVKVSISASDSKFKEVIDQIEQRTDFTFFYEKNSKVLNEKVNVNVKNSSVKDVLGILSKQTGVSFKQINKTISIKEKPVPKPKEGKKIKVTGKVTDNSGSTLPGVSVMEKGTDNGVVSDVDGNYRITVTGEDAVLIFSFVGMETQEVAVGNRAVIDILLGESATDLQEVVVTALGIKREKKALGYAVSDIKSDELEKSGELNVVNSLAGKVAGLQLTTPSGSSMGSSEVILRGYSSINGNNQALIVVDGVIFNNSKISTGSGSTSYDRGQGISDLNPDDIESISVLKGANASALYGSMAANGVLVITTKRAGKKQGLGVTYKSGVTLTQVALWPDLQNEYGHGKNFNQFGGTHADGLPITGTGVKDDESWGPKMDGQLVHFGAFRDQPIRPYSSQPDNYKEPFRTGVTTDNSLSVAYSTEKTGMYVSLMHKDINEYVENCGGSKYGGSIRVTHDLTKKLKFDVKLAYSEQEAKNRLVTTNGGVTFNRLIAGPRNYLDEDMREFEYPESEQDWGEERYGDGYPKVFTTSSSTGNIYWGLYNDSNHDVRRRVVGNLSLTYEIMKDFNFTIRHGFDQTNYDAHTIKALYSRKNENGIYLRDEGFIKSYTSDFLFAWSNNKLVDKFTFGANFGGSQFRAQRFSSHFNGTGFPSTIQETINATLVKDYSYGESDKVINSLYGTGQVSYDNFLFLEMTYRNDWSSTLSDDNNSYGYGSVSGSYLFSEHLKTDWLDMGKIRYSYAEVGNSTDPYVINPGYTYSTGTNMEETLIYKNRSMPFSDLVPEKLVSNEIGLDLRLFKGRVNFDMTLYKSLSSNQIIEGQPISVTSGFDKKPVNAGEVENKGVEIVLGLTPVKTKDLLWNVNFTFADNNSMVKEMPDDAKEIVLYKAHSTKVKYGRVIAKEGEPFGTLQAYGYKRNSDGLIIVDDQGLPLRSEDVLNLGNMEKDWQGSVSSNLSYKGFSLGMQLDVSVGGEVLSRANMAYNEQGTTVESLNGREDYINGTGGIDYMIGNSVFEDQSLNDENGVQQGGVKNEGDNKMYAHPMHFFDRLYSEYIFEQYVEDMSYVKLRELSLTYSLPKSIVQKVSLQNVDFSIVGRNLWLIHKNTDHFDPSNYAYNGTGFQKGIVDGFWPAARTVSFSVKLKF